ncbi:methyl-accepting chemotaxis protein [Thermodesulfobacterium hveragerdense]|uniref:methyl-accepting chemotaxis protein n=1 Tax=Thermodesulfobacterium hveragerdense TaxID=53424 RepID=UPI0004166684|nr:methyl-accepting chemotaxis protein [Thermodesulfobacterium hveragerdense]
MALKTEYLKVVVLVLLPVSLFLSMVDYYFLSYVSFIPEKLRGFMVVFSAVLTTFFINVYLSHKGRIRAYNRIPEKTEKVFKKLKEAHTFCSAQRASFNDIFELFSRNIQETIKMTEEYIIEFVKKLESLYSNSKEQTELIKSSLSSGENLIKIIDRQIDYNRENIKNLDLVIEMRNRNLQENLNRIYKLREKMYQVTPVIDSIKNIAEQINILAINASIEAARAGVSGAGFSVIANEIRKLSNNTEKMVQEIQDKILSMIEEVDESYRYFKVRITKTEVLELVEKVRQNNQEMENDLSKIGGLMVTIINEINKQNEIIYSMVVELLGEVQFQDVIRQRLEKVCEALEELSKYNSELLRWVENCEEKSKPVEIKVLLEKFKERYIMADQRRVHAEVFEGETVIKKEAPQIELF